MGVAGASIVHHVSLVLLVLCILSHLGRCNPFAFFISFLYLYKVNERCSERVRRQLLHEERKRANHRRLISDSESLKWLNHAVGRVWPVCMEQIASQKFLLPVIPWFLDRFKPWTVKKAVAQHLYLGRSPPMFTEMRVVRESSHDDDLLLELGMNFLAADDMSAVLAVKLRKRLGFGISAKMHVTGMHIEGKILVGVKFLQSWPFLGRVRVCFIEPPYIQMTVKPIFHHGIDVNDLPGIATWLDKTLDAAFERTLVEPNMLVIDVKKFTSAATENWFTIDVKCPVAFAKLEILEAMEMQHNGLADPYVKGHLGPFRFQTKIQRKTLAPKWQEEFKIPITSWEACNDLNIEVRDKDPFTDDILGNCSINISDLRGGQRHDKWLKLENIETGKLRLAITIMEVELEKNSNRQSDDEEDLSMATETTSAGSSPNATEDPNNLSSLEMGQKTLSETESFEHKNVNQQHNYVKMSREKGKNLNHECCECSRIEESACNVAAKTSDMIDEKRSHGNIHKGLHKLGAVLHHSKDHWSNTGEGECCSSDNYEGESFVKDTIKEKAKNIVRNAGKSAHTLKTSLKRKVHQKKMKEDRDPGSAESDFSESSGALI